MTNHNSLVGVPETSAGRSLPSSSPGGEPNPPRTAPETGELLAAQTTGASTLPNSFPRPTMKDDRFPVNSLLRPHPEGGERQRGDPAGQGLACGVQAGPPHSAARGPAQQALGR